MLLRRLIIALLIGMLVPAATPVVLRAADDDESGDAARKVAPPDTAAQAAAEVKIKELFAADYAKRTPADRAALAKKLAHRASREGVDPTERFALLRASAEAAAGGGDVTQALESFDAMAKSYLIDTPTMRLALLNDAAKAVRAPEHASTLVNAASDMADQYLNGSDYESAVRAMTVAETAVKYTKDPALSSSVRGRAKELRDIQQQFERLQTLIAKLEANPGDADASLKVGWFYAFTLGDWNKAIPLLAKSDDAKLRELATRDTDGMASKDPDEQVALGDAWYEWAKSQSGAAVDGGRTRAAFWYTRAAPKVDDATLARITPRMSVGPTRTIDLLSIVDLTKDALGGKWSAKKGALAVESQGYNRLQFPYRPPVEYDYRVVFTPTGPVAQAIILVMPKAKGYFQLTILNGQVGFEDLNGKHTGPGNPSTRKLSVPLQTGRTYACVVRVRKDGVRAFINNEIATEWKTNYTDLQGNPDWAMKDVTLLGVATSSTEAVFQAAQVVEVSSRGTTLR